MSCAQVSTLQVGGDSILDPSLTDILSQAHFFFSPVKWDCCLEKEGTLSSG